VTLCVPVVGLNRFQSLDHPHAGRQLLACARHRAHAERIDSPDLQGVQFQFPGEKVHLGLVGKGNLRNPEPSHGPGDGVVGVNAEAFQLDVFDLIRPGGVNRGSGCHGHAIRRIGPPCHKESAPSRPGFYRLWSPRFPFPFSRHASWALPKKPLRG